MAGWVIYGIVALFALSGVLGISRAASTGGSVTQMGLCQWALAVGSLIAFGLGGWNKLHLVWVIPVGFFVSFTPIGRAMGSLVGVVTGIIFGGRRSAGPGDG